MFRWTLTVAMVLLVCLLLAGCSSDDNGGTSPTPVAPNPPTGLQVLSTAPGVVQLQWTDNATDEDAYYVEHSRLYNLAYEQVAALAANTVSFTDTGLVPGDRYFFRVRAGRGSNYSGYSNEVSAGGASVTIIAPNGGEAVPIGLEYDIEWTSSQLTGNVEILLSTDGGNNWPYTLGYSVTNTGSYTYRWLTEQDRVGGSCRLRIQSEQDHDIYDDSDANFSLYMAWAPDSMTAYMLYDVAFADALNGWIVGQEGTILHTGDAGGSWNAQGISGINATFRAAAALDTIVWVVGTQGAVLYSQNRGGLWSIRSIGTGSDLYGVFFTDKDNGWVVGQNGTIRHTANGGQTWAAQASGTSETLYSVDFTDSQRGWVVGSNGLIKHTTDGGASWVSQSAGSQSYHCVDFVDTQNGWAVGSMGGVQHTTNGGNSWTAQTSGTSVWLHHVVFTTSMQGMAIGPSGTILHTTNGGSTWTAQYSGVSSELMGLALADAMNGWAVGSSGRILSTTTGGH
jgi:photosystem II stability/assembly factor-like uncharacterized protein